MKQIFIVKPDTLSANDKQKLTKAGFVVIEHPNPSEVRIISNDSDMNGNDILLSAMYALDKNFPKESFSKELARRMLEKERENNPPSPPRTKE